jgi:hypothetical protein
MEQPGRTPVPETLVAASVATALTLVYSAPTPGAGSRYMDGRIPHESRVLSVVPVREALVGSGRLGVGETVLEATLASLALAGFADPRAAGYVVPFARAALLGETPGRVLARVGHDDLAPFVRALEAAGVGGALAGALGVALGAGKDATRRLRPRRAGTGLPRGSLRGA